MHILVILDILANRVHLEYSRKVNSVFESLGKILAAAGAVLLVIGGLMYLFSKLGLNQLPGDIVIKKGNFTFVFPVVSCIVISLVLSLIFFIINKLR